MIAEDRWNELISVRPIKKGDFFQIDPGTVHAIKAGTLILETQQSSDVTYRLYDYGRLQNGKPRELHIEKSIDVIGCPHKEQQEAAKVQQVGTVYVQTMVTCPFYTVKKITLAGGSQTLETEGEYQLFSVIGGEGTLDGAAVKKGDHFILPSGYDSYCLSGNLELMTSYTRPKEEIK